MKLSSRLTSFPFLFKKQKTISPKIAILTFQEKM
jgi:hypothetical protein